MFSLSRIFCASTSMEVSQEQRVAITRARYETLRSSAERFHQRKPRALGMEVEALHRLLAKDVGPDAFAIVLRSLVDERRVETSVAHPYG